MKRFRMTPSALAAFAASTLLATAHSAEPAQPATAATSPGLLPLEHFTKHDEFGTIKISPDGEFIAITNGKYGRSQIAFINLKEKKAVGGFRVTDNFEIVDFRWVSPTRIIYMLGQREYRAQPSLTGEIFAVNRDGSRHEMVYGFRAGQSTTGTHLQVRENSYASAELISGLKKDDENILIAEHRWRMRGNYWKYDPDAHPAVILLNTFNGRKRSLGVVPLGGATMLVDNAENVRFAIGRNAASRLAVAWKPTADAAWTAFDLPGFREEGIVPQRFSSDDRSVFFTGVETGKTFAALYKLDLQSQQVSKVHAFEDSDVVELIADFNDKEVVGVMGYSDKPIYHWLAPDDRAAKLQAALLRAFPGQDATITSTTTDGTLAIVFVDSDTNPGEFFMFDTTTKKADHLRASRQWIDPRQMRPKQPIELTARDGQRLHGYLTQPAGEGPHPLIVLPHGGPHGTRDTWEYDSEVQLFANRGYSVLQVNFRGSEGYGMDFNLSGYRQWGGTMQDDVTDATRWAIEQKIAPADRICIYGASYGGYTALMGAAKEPKLYRCAVGYAGVYDLELMFTSADIPTWRSGLAYLEEALGTDPADLRRRSPVHNAAKIEIPVMLVHGKEDWRADYEQATSMKTALEANGKKVEWMALGREGHGAYDETTRRDVYERILGFLDKNLQQP